MNELINAIGILATAEGLNDTYLPNVRVFKASGNSDVLPFQYQRGLIFVVQGTECVFYKKQTVEYNASNYLAVTVPITANVQVSATAAAPLLALVIDFDVAQLNAVIRRIEQVSAVMPAQSNAAPGLFVSTRTKQINSALLRLSEVLHSQVESHVLGPLLLEELMFRVLSGDRGYLLGELTQQNSRLVKIHQALTWIHDHFTQKTDIASLAARVNMSTATFHRVFKELTDQSPMQYVKSIRLMNARALIASGGTTVNSAAHEVGYESVSQFSREFKRAYGVPPKQLRQLA